ncbi:hypothetical protein BZG36_04596 [Bifiguratus adelaidae]|uniref:Protein Zds1 C-terminal domain-containing protein n=1 Tax=Bifiguratus adelaidae TaxID=1938954 RepID=A0A261XWG4_9FUNG|nr:hypothetical protein BZG36_04596 [Bifiguratus adelaidae]
MESTTTVRHRTLDNGPRASYSAWQDGWYSEPSQHYMVAPSPSSPPPTAPPHQSIPAHLTPSPAQPSSYFPESADDRSNITSSSPAYPPLHLTNSVVAEGTSPSILWVPASAHPELDPVQFQSWLRSHGYGTAAFDERNPHRSALGDDVDAKLPSTLDVLDREAKRRRQGGLGRRKSRLNRSIKSGEADSDEEDAEGDTVSPKTSLSTRRKQSLTESTIDEGSGSDIADEPMALVNRLTQLELYRPLPDIPEARPNPPPLVLDSSISAQDETQPVVPKHPSLLKRTASTKGIRRRGALGSGSGVQYHAEAAQKSSNAELSRSDQRAERRCTPTFAFGNRENKVNDSRGGSLRVKSAETVTPIISTSRSLTENSKSNGSYSDPSGTDGIHRYGSVPEGGVKLSDPPLINVSSVLEDIVEETPYKTPAQRLLDISPSSTTQRPVTQSVTLDAWGTFTGSSHEDRMSVQSRSESPALSVDKFTDPAEDAKTWLSALMQFESFESGFEPELAPDVPSPTLTKSASDISTASAPATPQHLSTEDPLSQAAASTASLTDLTEQASSPVAKKSRVASIKTGEKLARRTSWGMKLFGSGKPQAESAIPSTQPASPPIPARSISTMPSQESIRKRKDKEAERPESRLLANISGLFSSKSSTTKSGTSVADVYALAMSSPTNIKPKVSPRPSAAKLSPNLSAAKRPEAVAVIKYPSAPVEPYPSRLPLSIERSIYRLSHQKLMNLKRPLHHQVMISNFMFWYLSLNQQGNGHAVTPLSERSADTGGFGSFAFNTDGIDGHVVTGGTNGASTGSAGRIGKFFGFGSSNNNSTNTNTNGSANPTATTTTAPAIMTSPPMSKKNKQSAHLTGPYQPKPDAYSPPRKRGLNHNNRHPSPERAYRPATYDVQHQMISQMFPSPSMASQGLHMDDRYGYPDQRPSDQRPYADQYPRRTDDDDEDDVPLAMVRRKEPPS